MKTFSYTVLRRIVFSVYVLFVIIFCIILFNLGYREIKKARLYAEREKMYFDSLLKCRNSLNHVQKTFSLFLISPQKKYVDQLQDTVSILRKNINKLIRAENKRMISGTFSASDIKKESTLLISIVNTINADMNSPLYDNTLLVRQDTETIRNVLTEISINIQKFLENELNHVEIWQRQSVFFFNRLQYLLIVFFILTTVFSVIASFLFAYTLKSSLKNLSEGTHQLSSGNLKYRFKDIRRDEIGSVMYDFNKMAYKLENQNESLRRINEELKKRTLELIDANRHKDRFLANMSHELRTPLNSVIGFAELLITKAEKSDAIRIKNYAEKILKAAEHLLELISGLLQIAKADAGMLKPEFEKCNLVNTINETIDMLLPLAKHKSLELLFEKEKNEMYIYGDKRLLKQVFINLIGNAIKFTREGSIKVSVKHQNNEFIVSVSDTGIGISKKHQTMIFKDFYRVEEGLTSNYEGVGLGLTLTKRILELHNSRITVSSEEGKGSRFSCFFKPAKD